MPCQAMKASEAAKAFGSVKRPCVPSKKGKIWFPFWWRFNRSPQFAFLAYRMVDLANRQTS